MAKVVVVTSGKGGVGKTTSTAALGAALAQAGANVVVVDFDVGLRNLDLVMGAERRVVFDLINVVQGDAKLAQALIRDKRIENLSLLPASQTRDKDALTTEGVDKVIAELKEKFDWVICDSPAGIERGALLAMRNADLAVVVTNPEVSSVRDSDRIIGMLDSKTLRAERGERIDKHLLVTRYDAERGFGFIAPDAGGADLFVHVSVVRGAEPLQEGDRVRYRVRQSDRGPQADGVERV